MSKSLSSRKRMVLDVANLTTDPKHFIRTGIQEVIYQTVLASVEARSAFPEMDLILLPFLPRRQTWSHAADKGTLLLPSPDTSAEILRSIEEDLRLPSREIWGFDLEASHYKMSTDQIFSKLREADQAHFQSMAHLEPIIQGAASVGKPELKTSFTVYDLVPLLFPEFCDERIADWYRETVFPGLIRCMNHGICISRNSALDLSQELSSHQTARLKQVTAVNLPFELPKAGLSAGKKIVSGDYGVHLGSLEPRKNFEVLLDGFELFKSNHPDDPLQLVLIGATGWKYSEIERRLKTSPFKKDLVRLGYLNDAEMAETILRASFLAMISTYEGFGLPLAQATSLGIPTLCSLGSSLPEAAQGERVFVDSSSLESVSAGISLLRKNRQSFPAIPRDRISKSTWKAYTIALLKSAIDTR